ncbi:hypothetical protein GJU40_11005 [Bacillus lacus]|uniref:Metallophosphoesterase n=1 Tax=Metabacillus lacus TaxID=1983721 RepID=A0A7X2IZJ4_9BACI|nr:phosphodiester glycosidase family protein [Metabacillus lacus]MRX72676.1 hypothetical protein [Metabacillus lacus]
MLNVKGYMSILFTVLLVLQSVVVPTSFTANADKAIAAERTLKLGAMTDEWTKTIAPGAEQHTLSIQSARGPQEAYVMLVDSESSDLSIQAGIPNGKGFGMQTVRSQALAVSKPGHTVIGAFNGDFYNTSTGIPTGAVVMDGKILKSGNKESFGVDKDGKAMIGYPSPSFQLILNGKSIHINSLNGTRESNHLVLYSPERKSTETNAVGTEVVLKDIQGDVQAGRTATATVEKIIVGVGNEPVPEGKLVLSGHGTSEELLKSLQEGQQIELGSKFAAGWENVKESIAGNYLLVKDSKKTDLPSNSFTSVTAPRTAVGIKEDGSVFFTVVDGRQPGFSEGITVFELQDLMFDLGAVQALNLDGGGSSTFAARQPGESGLSVVNSPSDGFERSVANSLFVVSSAQPSELSQLAVLPDRLLTLAGSSHQFDAKGMDASYQTAEMLAAAEWTLSDSKIGTISKSGLFTAGKESAQGQVISTSGTAQGTSKITVVDTLTQIKLAQDTLTVKRGEEIEIFADTRLNGKKVMADPSSLTWKIEGSIGKIENGVFTASKESGQGSITVSYGEVSDTMNVRVGKMPVILEDFEENFSKWTFTGARYNSIAIRQTTYPEPARFGNHSLQLDYDFTGQIGTSGAYAHPREPIAIDDYPESIGMWVYGDGKGHWLRAQLRDGNNSAFPIDFAAAMNWTGWKYVEAKVPSGKPMPLKMDMPVRLMETNNNNKNAGTIYVDNIRAVYGETNDDLVNPEISELTPAENSVVKNKPFTISAVLTDEQTGIHAERSIMLLDGKEVPASYNEKTGVLSYTPQDDLLDGYHSISVIARDNFGNETVKSWDFEVDTGEAGFKMTAAHKPYVGNNYKIQLQLSQIQKTDSLKLHLRFDPALAEVAGGTARLNLDKKYIKKNESDGKGNVFIELDNLSSLKELDSLGELELRVKESATGNLAVGLTDGRLKLQGSSHNMTIYHPAVTNEISAHLSLKADRASMEFPSVITVKDEKGKPVAGAEVKLLSDKEYGIVKGNSAAVYADKASTLEKTAVLSKNRAAVILTVEDGWANVSFGEQQGWMKLSDLILSGPQLGKTNAKGELVTQKLTAVPGKVNIQAVKNEQYSYQTEIHVLKHLGTVTPEKVNVTLNGRSNSRSITWMTSPKVKTSVVEFVEEAEYQKNGFDSKKTRSFKGESSHHPMNEGELQAHTVELKGLKPEATYKYRAGDGTNWSVTGTLQADPKGNKPFSFHLMGDTQAPPNQTESGFGIYTELLKKAIAEDPHAAFMLHVGDMVDDGNLYSHWHAFFESMKDPAIGPSMPIVPTVGNHENIGNGVETFKKMFSTPQNGPEEFKGTVYSFDYGNAHFAVLNTETSLEGLKKQAEWLKKDMKKSSKKWKIVMNHRSPYYSNPQGGAGNAREVLPPVYEEIGIDLAISGHDHAYVRTFPMKDGKKADKGTTYLIAGSTGGKFYAATPADFMDVYFDEKTQVYSNVKVDDKGISITAKARDGRVIDSYTITK